jgi:hypothetical protein
VSNENRRRAARSGWTRRRGTAECDRSPAGEAASSPDVEAVYEAYRAAKARHDAAIAALKGATSGRTPPDPELVKRQAEAAVAEIEALAAVRGLVRPPAKPDAT